MDEAEILSGLRAGSSEAHEALYDAYAGDLYDYCYALLQDDAAAAAVLRETLLHVAASSDAMPDGCSLRAWLYALARGKCRAGGDRMIEHPVPPGDPSALLLITVLGTLTARDREILELTGRHGLSTTDLEPILGLPPEKVESLVAEARNRFDQAMTAELDRTGPVEYPALAAITEGGDPLVLLFQAVPRTTPPEDERARILEALLAGATGAAAVTAGEDASEAEAKASTGAVPAAAAVGAEIFAADAEAFAAEGHPTDEIPVVGGDAPGRKRGLLVGAAAAVVLVAGVVFGLTQLVGSSRPDHPAAAVPTSTSPAPTSAQPADPPSPGPREHLIGHDPAASDSPSPSKSGRSGKRHRSRTGSHGTTSSSRPSSPSNPGGGSSTPPTWPPYTPPPGHNHPPGGGHQHTPTPTPTPTGPGGPGGHGGTTSEATTTPTS